MATAVSVPARIHVPERKSVVLWNEKLRRPTKHTYERTDRVERVWFAGGKVQPAYAFVFRCLESGDERQYGLEAL